jgi:hypothetical protein
MTDINDIDIESLKAEIASLYQTVATNAEAKVNAERDAILKDIASLSAELNQDFKVEDYKEVSLESLRYKAGVLQDVIKMLKAKSETGDLAGLVTRDGGVDELSAEQLEDVVLDLIQLAFGLEPANDEIKKLIRFERMRDGYELRG